MYNYALINPSRLIHLKYWKTKNFCGVEQCVARWIIRVHTEGFLIQIFNYHLKSPIPLILHEMLAIGPNYIIVSFTFMDVQIFV